MFHFRFLLLGALMAFCQLLNAQDLTKAIELYDAEKYSEAQKALTTLITAQPTNPELFYWNGMTLYALEKFPEAKAEFQKGIKAKSKFALNHVGLGRSLQKEGKTADADLAFTKAKELNKANDVKVMIALADAYLDGKRTKDAEVILYQAQAKYPDNPSTYKTLGDMYVQQGVFQLARNQYEKAIVKDPKFVFGYLRLGQMAIREGDEALKKDKKDEAQTLFKQGLAHLDAAIAAKPDFTPAYRERGELYFRARNYEKSKEDYGNYVKYTEQSSGKKNTSARQRYATLLFLSQDYKDAIKEISALDEKTDVLARLLGYAYYYTGDSLNAKTAMESYFTKVESKYRLASDYDVMANTYLKLGDLDNAVVNFEEAMKLDSTGTKVEAYKTIAEEYVKRKDAANEIKYRQLYVEKAKSPSWVDFYYLANAYMGSNDLVNAEKYFTKVTELKPDNDLGFYYLGRIAASKDKTDGKFGSSSPFYAKAAAVLEAKADRKPKETERLAFMYSYMAIAAYDPSGATHDCANAKLYAEKCLAITPTDENALQLRDVCK